jgi:hypothetical protein
MIEENRKGRRNAHKKLVQDESSESTFRACAILKKTIR